ncbi:MAG: hypothetical protein K1W14_06655 [Muribaculaceae bacterium]|jgi:hypothetical protein
MSNATKIVVIFLMMLISGIAGLILFFGDTESIVKTIISKPIGIILLIGSCVLHENLKERIKYL